MKIKFQYNKTSLHRLKKQLAIRERALPTLKNKEAALRVEVKNAKDQAGYLDKKLSEKMKAYAHMVQLWSEFKPELVHICDVKAGAKKIAGVKTPVLEDVSFTIKPFSIFNNPKWYLDGVNILQELARISIEKEFFIRKMQLLDHARKKTTQKVNLYEKVQIPGFQDAIRKINRFLEDEENLSKSSQKIVKSRKEEAA
ncbi:MAG: V-type ATP synthase subunit D [Bacteroidales bacterium]|nr:V-type ATP synthase subunit D [Bacteroidales bacterium]MCF8344949.1 V-type ATP synthase subunit D [Bacteroidales bacterium]MCF8352423.1 V-type ATP synthase subunit D [Bacteroidales bacterium]MCF8375336.1 V-type ATP synthase subunit D [Bacteroidales bacterium]MCF8400192.1 V-type ATP synthase subunit D [Bacteroidales bacterium]